MTQTSPRNHLLKYTSLQRSPTFKSLLHLSFAYFVLTFLTGFLFGTIRETLVIDYLSLSSSLAKTLELPFMLLAIIIWSRFMIRQYEIPSDRKVRVTMGFMATIMMLGMEVGGGRVIRGRSTEMRSLESGPRDTDNGRMQWLAWWGYLFDLAVFGCMPWAWMLIERGRNSW
jgi:hypothetical protein